MKKEFTIAEWQKDPGQKVVNSKGEEINVCEKSLGWIMAHSPYLYIEDEPELTEFEQAVADMCFDWQNIEPENRIMTDSVEHAIKEHAAELLSLAREQLIHEGYIIEKKAFHDAVEKVEPEVMKEVEENVDKGQKLTEFEQCLKSTTNVYVEQGRHMEDWDAREDAKELLEIAHKQILAERKQAVEELMERCKEQGKADALKDLPRWSPNDVYPELNDVVIGSIGTDNHFFIHKGRIIHLESLEKLPGFKEE